MRWIAHRTALGLLLLALMTAPCRAQADTERVEYRVKAAFVCKFASYVQWPPESFERADSPIVIGVIASDAVADELVRAAAGQPDGERPLRVRRLRGADALEGLHLVYIARSEESQMDPVLGALKGLPVLVVTESSRAPVLGSMINFVVVDNKVRFDIAPHVAETSRLRISARLLGVARSLMGRP